jgi:hypothetical protein
MPTEILFREWPKIPRLNREMIVTEKIDGTNAAVVIQPADPHPDAHEAGEEVDGAGIQLNMHPDEGGFERVVVAAQSRKQIISPEKDNFGFALWVRKHAQELADVLGIGYHYGEWYGAGIQRGYGLTGNDKRFMLFNVKRWADHMGPWVENMEVATVLEEGVFSTGVARNALEHLREHGSQHVPGFDRPEGIIVFHPQGNVGFKATLEKDEEYKGKGS